MAKRKTRDKNIQKTVAKNRINKLFLMAEQCALTGKLHLANRYVEIARKLSMRYLVPLPREFKSRFCKHCYCYLLPDVTSRVRFHRGKIVIYCNNCQKYTRIPLKKSGK